MQDHHTRYHHLGAALALDVGKDDPDACCDLSIRLAPLACALAHGSFPSGVLPKTLVLAPIGLGVRQLAAGLQSQEREKTEPVRLLLIQPIVRSIVLLLQQQ